MILAIISVLLCWVPIVNNLVFILGLLALGLGIAAVVSAFRSRPGSKGMAVTATCLSVLSLIGVLGTQAFYGSMFDTTSPRAEPSNVATGGGSDPKSSAAEEAPSDVAAIGEKREVSDYDVSVTGVNLNAAEPILAANSFNEPATGQYVLVDLTVQYLGTEEANPWLDLNVTFVGSDARQYDASSCDAVPPLPASDVPTLENTGTASYQVCMDVPPEAIPEGKLFVERSLSLNDARVYWAIN
ncbi:hypothetical protein I6N91_00370 [Arthrobacter sp. MSA 4-2]|uniref:hypothetical protein n=1 Tax=Arthrobacter sp. MSA 4-2 TaxID=2794349 RepID=UPI001A27B89B|nr:hypothetical protein [Arthrobacter sp. MSA 4-2]MBJ2119428.1 hypothetical protein [Arthrobacter sp. MSA 4-2]